MTTTLLAISTAYVVLALVVLSMGLTSRFAWWVKASTIVISSVFFVEVFFASKSLLGWPAPAAGSLPSKFQLLWTRVVEPDVKAGHRGAIFLWVEELDANNVPSGLPRSFRLPYSVKLADRTLKARDEIMAGNPQEGLAEELAEGDPTTADATAKQNQQADGGITSIGSRVELEGPIDQIPRVEFRAMSNPLLPPKP
jgi:hypothetical protein